MARTLRVEDAPPVAAVVTMPAADRPLDEWRAQAVQTGQRLAYAEKQLKDLRATADELRARLTKSKERQDAAQAKNNELQAQVVALMAERDELAAKLAPLEAVRQKAWDVLEDAQQQLLSRTL